MPGNSLPGLARAGVWISMDVTAYVTGKGSYNLAFSLARREGETNAPQLIIETGP